MGENALQHNNFLQTPGITSKESYAEIAQGGIYSAVYAERVFNSNRIKEKTLRKLSNFIYSKYGADAVEMFQALFVQDKPVLDAEQIPRNVDLKELVQDLFCNGVYELCLEEGLAREDAIAFILWHAEQHRSAIVHHEDVLRLILKNGSYKPQHPRQ